MIIGLTGGIGSGKSAAASFFMDLGINVLDADHVSRDALEVGSTGYDLFINVFGSSYLDENNSIDRAQLRSVIFSNPEKKLQLENIIHPIVRDSILDFIDKSQSPYTIIMVPLIFETNSANNYSRILNIDCDIDTQILRTTYRDAQNTLEVMNIINKQASREERLSIADDTILNSSSLNSLKDQVLIVHNKYMEIIKNG
jgi:dephospho-CoA kinase